MKVVSEDGNLRGSLDSARGKVGKATNAEPESEPIHVKNEDTSPLTTQENEQPQTHASAKVRLTITRYKASQIALI